MLKVNDIPESGSERAAFQRLTEWAEKRGTLLIECPSGAWYCVMWLESGEAPVLQYVGDSVLTAHANLICRRDACYGPRARVETDED